MREHRQRGRTALRVLGPTALLIILPLTACGPTVFEGASALAVVGEPPPPPPPPEPPPEPPKRVTVTDKAIVITEKIQFEVNKANILPVSDSLLDEIAKTIQDTPRIKKIAIEGHASAEGNDKYNLKLSDKRSKAVMAALVKRGIGADKLTAKGYGETRPIAENETEDGREKNRRVEFNIVEQDVAEKTVEVDPKTGKEKVLEERTTSVSNPSAPTPSEAEGSAGAGDEPADSGGDKKPKATKLKPKQDDAAKQK